jgi:hypothetical protein
VVGPADIIAELWGRKDYLTISPGALSDVLARKALRPDVRARILARTRGILRANYPVIEEWVKGARGGVVPAPAPGGGHRVPPLRVAGELHGAGHPPARRAGRAGGAGRPLGMDGFLRIGFGGDPGDLRRGLAAIDAHVSRLPRR